MKAWRALTLFSSCASLALLSTMPATAQSSGEPALQSALWGAAGGTPVTLAIPESAEFTGLIVYGDDGVNGLQILYRTADGNLGQTPLAGSAEGPRQEFRLQPGETARFMIFKQSYDWPNQTNPANRIQQIDVSTSLNRRIVLGKQVATGDAMTIAKIGPGTTFGGLYLRADDKVRAVAGLQARANVALPSPAAFAPQVAVAPPQPVLTRPQQPSGLPVADPAPASGGGFNPWPQSDPAQQSAPPPSGGSTDLAWNPGAPQDPDIDAGQGVAPPPQGTGQPVGTVPRTNSNPFTGGNDDAFMRQKAANEAIAKAEAARTEKEKYDGTWTEVNGSIEQVGRSASDAIGNGQYIAPRALQVTGFSPTYIVIENVNSDGQDANENKAIRTPRMGVGIFGFKSQGNGKYVGDMGTVEITPGAKPLDDVMELNLTGGWAFLSGTFERARIADGKILARDRFLPAVQEGRDSRTSKFSNVVTLFSPSLSGHDPFDKSPLVPRAGIKARIFNTLGDFDYSYDDELSVNVPYGLRGLDANAATSTSTSFTITSATETQKNLSVNMGVSVLGFGANFAAERTTTNSSKSEVGREYSFVRLSRYALVLDLPNMSLSTDFRRRIEALAAGGTDYQGLIATYGTHYANAVTYGALGYSTTETISNESSQTLAEKFNVGASGEYKGVAANAGGASGTTRTNSSGSSSSNSVFTYIGGSGTGDRNNVQSSDDKLVPILYDLRPISELINPVLFPTGADQARRIKLQQVRQGIDRAIAAREAARPKLSDQVPPDSGSRFYRLRIDGIGCITNDGRKSINLAGKVAVKIEDSHSPREISIVDYPMPTVDATPLVVPCSDSLQRFRTTVPLSISQAIIRGAGEVMPTFTFSTARIYDYKKPVTTSDDDLRNSIAGDFAYAIVGKSKDLPSARERIAMKSSTLLTENTSSVHVLYQNQAIGSSVSNELDFFSNNVNVKIRYTIERLQ